MKKLITLFVICIAITTTVKADPVEKKNATALRTQVEVLLKDIKFEVKKETATEITFMITKNNELIVTEVSEVSKEIEKMIKEKLNYRKVALTAYSPFKVYKLPFRIILPE